MRPWMVETRPMPWWTLLVACQNPWTFWKASLLRMKSPETNSLRECSRSIIEMALSAALSGWEGHSYFILVYFSTVYIIYILFLYLFLCLYTMEAHIVHIIYQHLSHVCQDCIQTLIHLLIQPSIIFFLPSFIFFHKTVLSQTRSNLWLCMACLSMVCETFHPWGKKTYVFEYLHSREVFFFTRISNKMPLSPLRELHWVFSNI